MSAEALVLGLLSAVRGVPVAVVYALLLTDRPRRLLGAYVGAGLAISLAVGVAVVVWFGATAPADDDTTTTRLVVDLVLGLVALAVATVRAVGRRGTPREARGPARGGVLPEVLAARLRAPTVPLAAAVGVLTNLPGLYYVAALVAVLETRPTTVGGIAQVLVYNALRFALPVAALALVVLRPDRTLDTVGALHGWGRRNERVLVASVVGGVGVYLVAKAVAGLAA